MDVLLQLQSPELASQLEGLAALQKEATLQQVRDGPRNAILKIIRGHRSYLHPASPYNEAACTALLCLGSTIPAQCQTSGCCPLSQDPVICHGIATSLCSHIASSNKQLQLAASNAIAAFASWRNNQALEVLSSSSSLQVGQAVMHHRHPPLAANAPHRPAHAMHASLLRTCAHAHLRAASLRAAQLACARRRSSLAPACPGNTLTSSCPANTPLPLSCRTPPGSVAAG